MDTITTENRPKQPRAIGHTTIRAKARDSVSVLGDLRQSGSLRVLFPRPASPPTAMLVNTAGGITGGDRFDLTVQAGENAALTVTTQAAERAYAAPPDGPEGTLTTTASVSDGGRLNWLPQETILFNNCNFNRRFDLDLAETGEALIVEPLVFGRPAHGETLTDATFHERIRVRRNGRVIYADQFSLTGDIQRKMAHPATGNGAGAMATLLLAAQSAEAELPHLRSLTAQNSGSVTGVSLLAPNLLALRTLADDSFTLRQCLLPVLDHLTQNHLPICWRL